MTKDIKQTAEEEIQRNRKTFEDLADKEVLNMYKDATNPNPMTTHNEWEKIKSKYSQSGWFDNVHAIEELDKDVANLLLAQRQELAEEVEKLLPEKDYSKPQQPESLGQSDACFDGNHKNCGWHCNCECHTTSSPNPQQPEKCEHEWKNDGQQHSKLWCIKCGLVHGAGVEDYYDKRLIKSHKPKQKIAKFDKNFYWDIHDEVRDKINEIIDFFNLDIEE